MAPQLERTGMQSFKYMSKKFILILIVSIIGLLIISLFGYYFILDNGAVDPVTGKSVGFRSFLPFGGNNNEEETPRTETQTPPATQNNDQTQTNFVQKLRLISREPVSGMGLIEVKAGTLIRYIEKATGHIYETEMFSPKQGRISNTTIPVVYDAIWGNGGNSLVARYLKDDNNTVDTYSLNLKNISSTTETTTTGIAMPSGIVDVSVFGNSIFFLTVGDKSSTGYIEPFDGTKQKLIWSSDLKEVLSQYVNTKTIALTTKPLEGIPGYMYFVDTATGATKSILSKIPGLSTLTSPDATKVLYISLSDAVHMYLYNISKRTSDPVSPSTFPEKCVWSNKDADIIYCAVPKDLLQADSLTKWYMGKNSTNDDIWKYDLKNNITSIVADLSTLAGQEIDVIKPTISANGQYLVFINKIDNSLWSLDLTK
jgi:hypothetical protein